MRTWNLITGLGFQTDFWVYKSDNKQAYIEISNNGDIDIWDYKEGKHDYSIEKQEVYVMMFQLAWALNN